MILAAVFIFAYFLTLFIIGTARRNNGIVDIFWGLGFVAVGWLMFFTRLPPSLPRAALTLLVTLWGLRLFLHILRRNRGKPEDFRYAAFRKAWGRWAVPRAFLQVYMLQGLLMYVISLGMILPSGSVAVQWPLFGAGLAVFAIGIAFEAVGDRQLRQFLRDPANRGTLLTTGLWRYTRHPNYFGEATVWWGLWLLALSDGAAWYSVASPLTITALLLFVSGVPPLEKAMRDRPGFAEYARRTSVFIPWFPRKHS